MPVMLVQALPVISTANPSTFALSLIYMSASFLLLMLNTDILSACL